VLISVLLPVPCDDPGTLRPADAHDGSKAEITGSNTGV
jgi:hypothetical protein